MKLSKKGHHARPPRLPAAAQRVVDEVASWDGVIARAHWLLGDETQIDGADFYFGDDELGHIHLDSEAHVMLPTRVAQSIIASGLAQPLPWSGAAVVFSIARASDVAHAVSLFRMSYERRRAVEAARSSS